MPVEVTAPDDLVTKLHRNVLRVTSVTYLLVGLITTVVFLSIDRVSPHLAWYVRLGVGVLLTLTGFVGVLMRRQPPLVVVRVLSMAPAAFILAPAVVLGLGVRAATLPAMVVVVVISGLLVGARAALLWAGFNIASFAGLLVAERLGWLPAASVDNLPPAHALFISLSATMIAVGLLVASYSHVFREAIAQLERARAEADAASAAKSRFLAMMSHEIRTPLNGVLGMAQALHAGSLTDAEREESVLAILHTGKVLQAVLNDVLDLSRAEAGQLIVHPVPAKPQVVFDDTRALFAELARTSGHELRSDWSEPERTFSFDAVRVRQMLGNLVSNAIKFTPACVVTMRAQFTGQCLRFEVHDQGPTLSEDQRARLFQPFQQLDDSATRTQGGSGLGLSIVRRLAEAQGGTAGVSGRDGGGSVFWFEVKAAPVDVPEISEPVEAPFDGSGLRVLVVEDNPVNRRVAELLLKRHRFEVQCATNGREALSMLEAQDVDLVLMDCQMPEMDGFEATRELRRRERGPRRLPIIALTASAFPEERQQCLDSGMDDLLLKPLDVRQLSAMLTRRLG
jgi:signal transduction histidine kinase/CheY-like chemotaxis protein